MRTTPQTRPLRTARYLVAFTEEEKAQLDQRCRVLAARLGRPVSLADVLREGARLYLKDLELGQSAPPPIGRRRAS
jgi:hypothetical protein